MEFTCKQFVMRWCSDNIETYQRLGFWLGGRDIVTEGLWQWHSDNKRINYTAWGNGQPDNNVNKNYLGLSSLHNFKWNNYDHLVSLEFICQKKYEILLSLKNPTVHIRTNKCYNIRKSRLTLILPDDINPGSASTNGTSLAFNNAAHWIHMGREQKQIAVEIPNISPDNKLKVTLWDFDVKIYINLRLSSRQRKNPNKKQNLLFRI
ncbi:hypothetical protein KUTeg_007334 [Tegillarca granosa]|uniref:C-type lectin domain-containing protein n=1 Tax=Tegillarca granosa TaxID=220873 RepID=A0ABQ9FCZ0_TEGGR|nr:hypothetical protein KUTeg_007334 [Tegillarca granosa]